MALHGEGEPQPTLIQVATQAAKIQLYTQWQTYRNGVHMDDDTFNSVDFRAIAVAVLTAAGFEVTTDDVADHPQLRKLLTQPSPFVEPVVRERTDPSVTLAGTSRNPYGLSDEAIREHGAQVQG